MPLADAILDGLFETGAMKVEATREYKWTSGVMSPIYTDLRSLIGIPDVRDLIVNSICERIGDVDLIAGTATAGIPWAAFVAQKMGLPMLYVRSKSKEHGTAKKVEGFYKPGANVLVIEDLISTGGSLVNSVNSLREVGLHVDSSMALFSYALPKADAAFSEAKLYVESLMTIKDVLVILAKRGETQKVRVVKEFLAEMSR